MRPARYITALCSAGLTLLAAGFVLGQHIAPTDYHLVSEEVLATIDLVKEIDSVQNRELRLGRAVASPGYPFDEPAVRARIERDAHSGVRDVSAQARQAGAKWHSGPLAHLRRPVLVLHGDADPLLRPAAGRATAAAIAGARLLILPGVGHDLPAPLWPEIARLVWENADRAG